jgi:hypothetical protein
MTHVSYTLLPPSIDYDGHIPCNPPYNRTISLRESLQSELGHSFFKPEIRDSFLRCSGCVNHFYPGGGGNSSGCGISYQYLHTYFRQPQEILLASSIDDTCFRIVYCNAWERSTRTKYAASTDEANKICFSWPSCVCKYWCLTTRFQNKGN